MRVAGRQGEGQIVGDDIWTVLLKRVLSRLVHIYRVKRHPNIECAVYRLIKKQQPLSARQGNSIYFLNLDIYRTNLKRPRTEALRHNGLLSK